MTEEKAIQRTTPERVKEILKVIQENPNEYFSKAEIKKIPDISLDEPSIDVYTITNTPIGQASSTTSITTLSKVNGKIKDTRKDTYTNINLRKISEDFNISFEDADYIGDEINDLIYYDKLQPKNITILIDGVEVQPSEQTKSEVREILERDKELLKQKIKKKTIKPFKLDKRKASMPTSKVSEALMKDYNGEELNKSEKEVISNKFVNGVGEMRVKLIDNNINPFDIEIPESQILSKYKSMGFNRKDLQMYVALFDAYVQNVNKKEYGKPFKINVKDLHKIVLDYENRLRKSDIEKYRSIFSSLSLKRFTYKWTENNIKPLNKKEFKNIIIDSNLISVDVETNLDDGEQIITITPTKYMLFELNLPRQISNYFPRELIELNFDKSDNIFYFGVYICRMHKINARTKIDGKQVTNQTFAWQIGIETLIKEALPNGEQLIQEYKNAREKSKFLKRNIINPLNEAIEIYNKNKYITHTKLCITEKTKKPLEEIQKFIFQYDVGKLLKIDRN